MLCCSPSTEGIKVLFCTILMSVNKQSGINVLCEHVAVKNPAWYHSSSSSCRPTKHAVKNGNTRFKGNMEGEKGGGGQI